MKRTNIIFFLCCTLVVTAQNRIFTVGGQTIEMVPVKGGIFYMGAQSTDPHAPNYDPQAADNEGPVHKVQVSDFWISTTCVSQGFWQAVTGLTPHNDGCITEDHCQLWYEPYTDDIQYPAYYLTYVDVQKFLSTLNSHPEIKQQITFGYREGFYAPTEAQWEYAARGGANAEYYIYAGSDDCDEVAWVNCTDIPKMQQKMPNALGLYDMCGSMAEWCKDKFGAYDEYNRYQHPDSVLLDPENSYGNYQVKRGGLFARPAIHNRIATRSYGYTDARSEYHGFRLVMRAPILEETTSIPSPQVSSSPTFIQQGALFIFDNILAPTCLTIYSLDGQSLLTKTLTAETNQLDLSNLPSGMYVLVCGSLRQLIVQ